MRKAAVVFSQFANFSSLAVGSVGEPNLTSPLKTPPRSDRESREEGKVVCVDSVCWQSAGEKEDRRAQISLWRRRREK